MKENYFIIIAQANDVIKEFEKKVLEIFFTSDTGMQLETASNPYMCFTPVYVQYSYPIKIVIELFDLLKIENLKKDVLDTFVKNLNNPIYVSERARFKHTIDALSDVFEKTKEDIENAVRKLSTFEQERLEESVHNLIETCYFSAIAMAVSAIESRLLMLMKSILPASAEHLDTLTLGQLIREYIKDASIYKNFIPEKHKPLLDLCNTYRIFSVHPKNERISKNIARAILNLAFEFLLDEKLELSNFSK